MSTISSDDLRAILAGCDGVTPGPWANGIHHRQETRDRDFAPIFANGVVPMAMVPLSVGGYQDPDGPRNAAHIARLDPQTVASIITELLSLRESHPIEDGEGWILDRYRDRDIIEAVHRIGQRVFTGQIGTEQEPTHVQELADLILRRAAPSNPGTSKVENSRST